MASTKRKARKKSPKQPATPPLLTITAEHLTVKLNDAERIGKHFGVQQGRVEAYEEFQKQLMALCDRFPGNGAMTYVLGDITRQLAKEKEPRITQPNPASENDAYLPQR